MQTYVLHHHRTVAVSRHIHHRHRRHRHHHHHRGYQSIIVKVESQPPVRPSVHPSTPVNNTNRTQRLPSLHHHRQFLSVQRIRSMCRRRLTRSRSQLGHPVRRAGVRVRVRVCVRVRVRLAATTSRSTSPTTAGTGALLLVAALCRRPHSGGSRSTVGVAAARTGPAQWKTRLLGDRDGCSSCSC